MNFKDKIIASGCLTALIGMGMLVGWGLLNTEYWWLAVLLLALPTITLFAITRDN